MIVIKNSRLRKILKILLPCVLMPLVIFFGSLFTKEKGYAALTAGVAALSVILFICGFEKKKTGTRRLVIVSAMVALCVIGRFIPFFKPVTALAVLVGICLGGEAGFLTGAMAALISNFYFGQGPWTPFQMFAWGLIGLLAGILSKPLNKSKILLLLYGIFSGAFFSFIMDIWSVLWYNGSFDLKLYLAAMATALPHTLLYCISNVIFLSVFSKPFCEKLNRVKLKYDV